MDEERPVIRPQPKPQYTLDELLSKSSADESLSEEDRVWLDLFPIGREL
jgi:antitoxin ChpS